MINLSFITVTEGRTAGQGDEEVGKWSMKFSYIGMKGKNKIRDSFNKFYFLNVFQEKTMNAHLVLYSGVYMIHTFWKYVGK